MKDDSEENGKAEESEVIRDWHRVKENHFTLNTIFNTHELRRSKSTMMCSLGTSLRVVGLRDIPTMNGASVG